jgi:hypothetical protein
MHRVVVTRPFPGEPPEVSHLSAILTTLYSDRLRLQRLLQRAASPFRPKSLAIHELWSEILKEAGPLDNVISILNEVHRDDLHADRRELVRAIRAYRVRRQRHLDPIVDLVDKYRTSLAKAQQNTYADDGDWVVKTVDVSRALKKLDDRLQELALWRHCDDELDQSLRRVGELLKKSRMTLGRLRSPMIVEHLRREHLAELSRVGRELTSSVENLP